MSTDAKIILGMFCVQLIILPIQFLALLAMRREKEEMQLNIKEAFRRALQVITTRRN